MVIKNLNNKEASEISAAKKTVEEISKEAKMLAEYFNQIEHSLVKRGYTREEALQAAMVMAIPGKCTFDGCCGGQTC